MTTKQKILSRALTLFAEKGYSAVRVEDIAKEVGIKAPSLYKHYKSKEDIFNAILNEMEKDYENQAAALKMDGENAEKDTRVFSAVSEDGLVKMGKELFLYFLRDDCVSKFRKMLTVEQFKNPELGLMFSKRYADDPLSYQAAIFAGLSTGGFLRVEEPDIMALQFYSPIYLLLTICDRQPERENEALSTLEHHIRQFNRLYSKEGAQ